MVLQVPIRYNIAIPEFIGYIYILTMCRRAKLGQIQGVAEGYPRFDKGGGCNSFYFYALKI